MLVIPRRRQESVVIDEHIVVTVVEIEGDEVTLEIETFEGDSIRVKTCGSRAVLEAEQPAPVA